MFIRTCIFYIQVPSTRGFFPTGVLSVIKVSLVKAPSVRISTEITSPWFQKTKRRNNRKRMTISKEVMTLSKEVI